MPRQVKVLNLRLFESRKLYSFIQEVIFIYNTKYKGKFTLYIKLHCMMKQVHAFIHAEYDALVRKIELKEYKFL